MSRVKMILVGGFLGAGKTTLLARAAERLAARGLRVGLITNDQAANLVDTELLRQGGQQVKEVSGACFCCAFNKLLYVCDNLIAEHHPDVIIGEPVGSCTDLAATVVRPIKRYCADRFDLAPYSVLVDPDRLTETMGTLATSDVARAVNYIYAKQIAEADLAVINKSDLLPADRLAGVRSALLKEAPGVAVMSMSALQGSGVDDWLDRMLPGSASGRVVDVDYDTYAAGEAALGWLNAAVELSADRDVDWRALAEQFMRRVQSELRQIAADIAHLKILLTTPGGRLQGNLTSAAGEPAFHGEVSEPTRYATLVVNARVRVAPDDLRAVVEQCLRATAAGQAVTVNIAEIASLRPGRPTPVHRLG
ncbi:MAG: GTP-binding protein [Phycisphaerae bacterium]|nr:GTP-binding protein [Phycisphaerae bacterium]